MEWLSRKITDIYPLGSKGKQAKNAAKIGTVTVRALALPLCRVDHISFLFFLSYTSFLLFDFSLRPRFSNAFTRQL